MVENVVDEGHHDIPFKLVEEIYRIANAKYTHWTNKLWTTLPYPIVSIYGAFIYTNGGILMANS